MKQNANIRSIWEHIVTTHGSSFLAVTHSARHASLTVSYSYNLLRTVGSGSPCGISVSCPTCLLLWTLN